ncbi:MAG: hypothetical protein NC489_22180 [Ruminococcus flavefaciens]|nr:hypothetical protein [Ruminococcus flavefaciens]
MKIYKNGELLPKADTVYDDDFDDIFGMSNLRGKYVKTDKINFSFYFSMQKASHAIRVKVSFNDTKINESDFGVLELHGDWKFTPGKNDRDVPNKDIRNMKSFFVKYKVLFAAVWNKEIYEGDIVEFFRKGITFSELLHEFNFYDKYKKEMNEIKDVAELEDFVRENNIFNMWD